MGATLRGVLSRAQKSHSKRKETIRDRRSARGAERVESASPAKLLALVPSSSSLLLLSMFFVLSFSLSRSDDFGLTFLSYPAFCSVEQTADGRSKLSDLMGRSTGAGGKKVGLGSATKIIVASFLGWRSRTLWIFTSASHPTIRSKITSLYVSLLSR